MSGRYRLEVTLHDGDGVALPYAVQASIPGLVVHVGGPGAAWLDAPPALSLAAGTLASLQVLATNGEATAWGACPPAQGSGTGLDAACPAVRLVGRWVALAGGGTAEPMTRELSVPAAAAETAWLSGPVPTEPGTYLLLLSLERAAGDAAPQVLGRPVTVTVVVAATPLLPVPGGDPTAAPADPLLPAQGDPADPLLPAQAPIGGSLLPAPGADPADPAAPLLPAQGGATPTPAPLVGSNPLLPAPGGAVPTAAPIDLLRPAAGGVDPAKAFADLLLPAPTRAEPTRAPILRSRPQPR